MVRVWQWLKEGVLTHLTTNFLRLALIHKLSNVLISVVTVSEANNKTRFLLSLGSQNGIQNGIQNLGFPTKPTKTDRKQTLGMVTTLVLIKFLAVLHHTAERLYKYFVAFFLL